MMTSGRIPCLGWGLASSSSAPRPGIYGLASGPRSMASFRFYPKVRSRDTAHLVGGSRRIWLNVIKSPSSHPSTPHTDTHSLSIALWRPAGWQNETIIFRIGGLYCSVTLNVLHRPADAFGVFGPTTMYAVYILSLTWYSHANCHQPFHSQVQKIEVR